MLASLCQSCGLCCDGTLFVNVGKIDADEQAQLSSCQFQLETVVDAHGGLSFQFQQPCSALKQQACRIYAMRPTSCREFYCSLAMKVEQGELTSQDAVSKIRYLVAAVATNKKAIQQLFDSKEDNYQRLYHQLQQEMQLSSERRQQYAMLWLEAVALQRYIERHFREHGSKT